MRIPLPPIRTYCERRSFGPLQLLRAVQRVEDDRESLTGSRSLTLRVEHNFRSTRRVKLRLCGCAALKVWGQKMNAAH